MIIILILIIASAFVLYFLYAMCTVASEADDRSEKFLRQLEAENKPHITGEL